MCNAATEARRPRRTRSLLCLLLPCAAMVWALVALLPACSPQEAATPQALLARADESLQRGRYQDAVDLVEQLDSLHPGAVDLRRTGMHIRARALEGLTLQRLDATDSLLLQLQQSGDSLERLMHRVDAPVEGYMCALAPDPAQALSARVSPQLQYSIVARIPGSGYTSVKLSNHSDTPAATSALPPDGERNVVRDGCQSLYFIGTDADTLGRFLATATGRPVSLTFYGEHGNKSVELPEPQILAAATAWRYADVCRRRQLALLEREKLEQQLAVARNQVARTAPQ